MDERERSSTDWRIHLQPDTRLVFANSIMEAMRMELQMTVSLAEALGEIKRMAVEFEELIYSSSTSQSELKHIPIVSGWQEERHANFSKVSCHFLVASESGGFLKFDYLRGISLKLHTIATQNQNNVILGEVDWRTHLSPEPRQRIVNKIMETLRRYMPISVPEGVEEQRRIAVRFEEKIYTAATSQSDYLRKIALKMLSMDTKSTPI